MGSESRYRIVSVLLERYSACDTAGERDASEVLDNEDLVLALS